MKFKDYPTQTRQGIEVPCLTTRMIEALNFITGMKPSKKLVVDWLNEKNNDLQDWVGTTPNIAWAQSICIIEAAMTIAFTPIDGAGDLNGIEDLS